MKINVEPSPEPFKMKTKTSKLFSMFVKLCFLPITVTSEKMHFNFFSIKTMIYLIYTFGFYIIFITINLVKIEYLFNYDSTFVDKLTKVVLYFSFIMAYSMPLQLAKALKNLNIKSWALDTLPWPKLGVKILLVSLGSFAGATLNDFLKGPMIHIWSLNFGTLLTFFYFANNILFFLGWFQPILIVAMFLQQLIDRIRNISVINFGCNISKILEDYTSINDSLQDFLLLWFSTFPCILTFVLFMAFAALMKSVESSFERAIADITLIGGIICSFSNVLFFSGILDETYQEMLLLRKKIHKRLYEATDKEEIKFLEYCKNEAELLRPFNAAGYFEIDKTTWTSILSFR